MRARIWMLVMLLVVLWLQPAAAGESAELSKYFSSLPSGLKAPEGVPARYQVRSIFNNRGIDGSPRSKVRLSAEYTRRVDGDTVHCRWNAVEVASPGDPSEPFPAGTPLDYMEGFDYTLSEAIMTEAFYERIPDGELKHLLKTLVWDAAMFEPVVWDHWNELTLNEDFVVPGFEGTDLKMGRWGALRMKGLIVRWSGVSKRNGELCALLQYRSYNNPVQTAAAVGPSGRSLYWGTIWVSLEDRQVEHATLNEDIVMSGAFPGGSDGAVINFQREVTFAKVP